MKAGKRLFCAESTLVYTKYISLQEEKEPPPPPLGSLPIARRRRTYDTHFY